MSSLANIVHRASYPTASQQGETKRKFLIYTKLFLATLWTRNPLVPQHSSYRHLECPHSPVMAND